ncbi:MAG: PAS domain-containing protein, partial [Coprothermobacterota bacterium]|nr:PAS domain-containing protein [Coprothermobacterota bacterium]
MSEQEIPDQPVENDHRFIQNVVDTTPNILYIFDFYEMRDTYANNAFYQILGFSSQEIKSMGSNLYPNLLNPDDAERVLARNQEMTGMKDGQVLEIEYRVKHRSGQWRWLHDRATVFSRNTDGSVRAILGSAEDITDRKNMEDALRQSEERFRVALKNAPIAVFNQDINLKYTWVHHPQTGILTAIEPGKSDFELLKEMDMSGFIAAKKSALKDGLGVRKEIKINKNEKQYYFDLTVEPLRDIEGHL